MEGLVRKTIQGLYNGVSQQAPVMRLDTQCAAQVNMLGTLVDGLTKRPNTKYLAAITGSNAASNSFYHEITTSDGSQYIMCVTQNAANPIEIYTLDGTPVNVWYGTLDANYVLTQDANVKNYALTAGAPRGLIRAVTVADHTIIVNRTVTAVMDTGVAQETFAPKALVWVKNGVINTNYYVHLNGAVVGNYMSAAAVNSTAVVLGELKAQLVAAGWTVLDDSGSVMQITAAGGVEFAFRVSDGWGNQALIGIKNTCDKITDLPPWSPNGYRVKITDADKPEFGNYYMQCVNDGSNVYWQESRGWGINNYFNAYTLPHRLVHLRDAQQIPYFVFAPCIWDDRKVGDNVSAPRPSFINQTINNVFFWKNRLGFLAGQNVCLSKAGDYFDFWPTTVMDVLDDDPIDIAAVSNRVVQLTAAMPFDRMLMLMSNGTQFMLHSGENHLTPKTVTCDEVTHFDTASPPPVTIGPNVYFVSPNGAYNAVREYLIQPDTLLNDAADITAHCPEYLPAGGGRLKAIPQKDMLLYWNADVDGNTLYAYKFTWNGNEKPQSEWCKWNFEVDTVYGACVFNNDVYLICREADHTTLEKLTIDDKVKTGDLTYKIYADRLCRVAGVYNGVDRTSFTLPYWDNAAPTEWVVIHPLTGIQIPVFSTSGDNTLWVWGNYHGVICHVGKLFTCKYRFSEWVMKDGQGNPMLDGRLQIKTMTLTFQDTGPFDVSITPSGRDPLDIIVMTNVHTAQDLGSVELAGSQISSGVAQFPILANSKGTIIEITSHNALPLSIQAATLEGFYARR